LSDAHGKESDRGRTKCLRKQSWMLEKTLSLTASQERKKAGKGSAVDEGGNAKSGLKDRGGGYWKTLVFFAPGVGLSSNLTTTRKGKGGKEGE